MQMLAMGQVRGGLPCCSRWDEWSCRLLEAVWVACTVWPTLYFSRLVGLCAEVDEVEAAAVGLCLLHKMTVAQDDWGTLPQVLLSRLLGLSCIAQCCCSQVMA